jgi:hypothetical protein
MERPVRTSAILLKCSCILCDPLSSPVSEPLTNRGVLLSTLLHAILHPSHHLLTVLLQIANKLGLSKTKTKNSVSPGKLRGRRVGVVVLQIRLHSTAILLHTGSRSFLIAIQ